MRVGLISSQSQGPSLISKYVGESERGIREVFKKGKAGLTHNPVFDEIDSLVPKGVQEALILR